MKFFSGFGFKNEKVLFKEYLDVSPFTVAGFSYGAQKALTYVLKSLKAKDRVEKLQLLSPAFFNHLPKERKIKEIDNFFKNQKLYMDFFYKRATYPYKEDISIFKDRPTLSQLKELLFFQWRGEDLSFLKEMGVEIEVFLATEDKIIDYKEAKSFFEPYATIYEIKKAGHLLRS
jgi:pimeloyl-ACP methyl ester carboxylesterase